MRTQKILMLLGPGEVRLQERPLAAPGQGDVVIRPSLSAFKHGTEMMAYTGRSPFARRTFDPDLRIFEDRDDVGFYPRSMGSMMAGVVEEAGREVTELSPGEMVYGWAPIADRHVMPASKLRSLGALSPEQALCIDPASFALGAVIDGAISTGETVLVTGLGAIGLFTVQYCVMRGAHVIAASSFEKRRALASRFGAHEIHDSAADADLARTIKETGGGVDAAIECSGNLATLHMAIRSARQCGRVVCVGFYGPGDARLNLGEEFFHNRISLLASLPALSWNNPTRGEPALHARDLQDRVKNDFEQGRLSAEGMLDPVLPFSEAERAVRLIADAPETVLKAALRH
ncbi:MAG: zinc-binding dehydrogenase [Rhodomicrobiaceae bacterium]